MVAPVAAVIGSLISGVFGHEAEKDAIRDQNRYNSPIEVRKRAEAAGFNPLLFIGPGVGQQTATGGGNYMGEAIANAGLALTDGIQKKQMMDIERSRLRMDQQKLDVALQNATIRPRSGGIYAGNVSAPSAGGVGKQGVSVHAQGSGSTSGGVSANIPVGNIATPASYLDRGTGLFVGGFLAEAPPGWSNGNAIENELGESVPAELMNWAYSAAYLGHNSARYMEHRRDAKRADMLKNPQNNSSGFSHEFSPRDNPNRGTQLHTMISRVPDMAVKKLPDNYWSWPSRDAWPKFVLK